MTEETNKILKIIILISLFLSPLFIILTIFIDLIIFPVIYIMIWLSIGGIYGGIWLWKALMNSGLFKDGVPIYIKLIGIFASAIFLIFIGMGFYLFYFGDLGFMQSIVHQGTILMIFIVFYNIGYLISIFMKSAENMENMESGFKIKIKLSLIVLCVMGIYLISTFMIFFLITQEFFSLGFIYFGLAGTGICIGWIFWEHLKESKAISGDFHKLLKILSIIFEIPIIFLMILGLITNFMPHDFLFRFTLLGYLLLFYLMAAYFIGLMLATIKK
ncbi:MAG: hypothetical protein EAX96_05040 [Candidatus Lokiarchaeota archaeon]|nr:hypothetical protein [Candidatus Lokiarchaeota archaeon]